MPPRFDAEQLRLSLSVADLIDTQLLRSLGFANRGGFERLWMGQAIHSRYQEEARAANPTYRAEVPLRHSLDHKGWTVEVSGRLDGLRPEADRLVVEEVKSVRDLTRASPSLREMYARQAQIYAWILRHEHEQPVDAELVWIEIASGEVVREPVAVDAEATERAVRRRLDVLLEEFSEQELARGARRQAAAEMLFPYPAIRPGQERILEAVERAAESGEHLLVEAPTGIGKTVAALYPALRYALAHDKRVLVLTAKNLQQEMITQVLEMLDAERAFHALRLRAKARMCAHDEVLCHEEYCPFARDYFQKLERTGVVDRLLETHGVLVPDQVFAAARSAEVCPFEVSLELAGRAQVVVGDYNYAFEPWVALKDFRDEESLSDWILVVDEMHNLVDRGRGYYSPVLSATRAGRAAEAIHAAVG
ncbi:MAG: DEAD/DEAH box helicase, partial [Thermoanaerobaculia bacterium]